MNSSTKKKQSSIFKKILQGYLIPLIISSALFSGVLYVFTKDLIENQV